jgi:hypothetical protein
MKVEGVSSDSQYPCKITVLENHKCEKNFKVSHAQKGESHKEEVLARIYFSITG